MINKRREKLNLVNIRRWRAKRKREYHSTTAIMNQALSEKRVDMYFKFKYEIQRSQNECVETSIHYALRTYNGIESD